MRLTRRGQAALAVAVVTVVVGWQFGSRALNAIAAPILAGMLVSALILSRGEDPSVDLSSPEPGFPGESRTLSLSLSGSGLVTVSLSLPEGIEGDTDERQLTLPGTEEFTLDLTGRGLHTVGPPTLSCRGPLGFIEQAVPVDGTTDVVVYPQRYSVEAGSILARLFVDELEAERQEFDRLREYQSGDPLRHVHWKSSAKLDEFLVMEFAPSQRDETVTVVATAPPGEVDEMARLAVTVTDLALDAGYNLELATPDGHVPPGSGQAHRKNILRLLARTAHGAATPISGDDADVEITTRNDAFVVRIGGQAYTLDDLLDETADAGGMDPATLDVASASNARSDTEVRP